MNELNDQLKNSKDMISSIEEHLIKEEQQLEENSSKRDKNICDMRNSIKISKIAFLTFGCLYLIFPMVAVETLLQFILFVLQVASIGFCTLYLEMYFYNRKKFIQNNQKAVINSGMIDILNRKLSEEKAKSRENDKTNKHISRLEEFREFMILARKYINSRENYRFLYCNDMDGKFFLSETEEAMTIEKFVTDDIKKEKEFEEELKVLKKVK